MLVKAVKCLNCGEIVYSRDTEDLAVCDCGNAYAHGGPFGRVYGGAIPDSYERVEIEVPVTDFRDLKYDYSMGKNRYGKINIPPPWTIKEARERFLSYAQAHTEQTDGNNEQGKRDSEDY